MLRKYKEIIDLNWFKETFKEPMYIGVAEKTITRFVGLGLVWTVGYHVVGNKNIYLLTKSGEIFYHEKFGIPFGRFNK